MKKIELKSRKFLRKIFAGISLTAVAFVFQACYGPMEDCHYDIKLSGTVTSKTTNLPIQGIKVSMNGGLNYGVTDKNGNFNFFANASDCFEDENVVHFLDIDGAENGKFAERKMKIKPTRKDEVRINVALEEVE
ncbi:MAG: carboxypeptidase-like regulatory domain-containing protein [Dysgonamonadaceae bacterium]|jgi:putative lipoprotein (rSAM/lipoprotein system)|nr:carboxypeptidase-like regulatory domain-containing protein [Dysgonamonadaceae bacterium]